MTRADAGRLGGLQTFLRYGAADMVRRGRLGGRPRLPTLAELEKMETEKLSRVMNKRRGVGRPPAWAELSG